MKVSIATLALVAQADDRKVPPRHPLQRINKLGIFMDNFAAEMVSMGKMKQGQADRFSDRMDNFLGNMKAAFERPNCGHYDADQGKHGGPDETPEINFNTGKARNRRDMDEEDLHEATHEWCAAEFADGYDNGAGFSVANYAECCGFSDSYCIDGVQAPRSGKGNAYDRLSNNPELKWKQITTGVRKWAQRYINNCHGQRKFKKASRRANKLYKTWDEKLF